MWKAELMKYKKECTFLLNQSGSSYLSLVLEVQGRAGAGRESLSMGQNHMELTQSLCKTPTSVLEFHLKMRLCETWGTKTWV